jgi:hypothetical protein
VFSVIFATNPYEYISMKQTHAVYTLSLCLFLIVQVPLTAQNWEQLTKAITSDRATNDNFGFSVAINGDYAIVGAPFEDENGNMTVDKAGAAYIFKWTGTTWVQEAKIVASDRSPDDWFGTSVSISGDYVVVGAYLKDDNATTMNTGAAYIFKRTGTAWNQEAKIVATNGAEEDRFGYSVAISGDYALVGAYNESEDAAEDNTQISSGSAYIFKRTGTVWAQETKIVASDRDTYDQFGWSVALSGDYAIVGAPFEGDNPSLASAGAAYVFKRSGTTWTQETKVVASDRAENDEFGTSVAISGDYAIVGAAYEDEDATDMNTQADAGSAYIFKRAGTAWAQEAKIVAFDRAEGDNFGTSVSISNDYAIVGAYVEDEDAASTNPLPDAGSAYIFKRTGTTWYQEAKIVASDRAESDFFGVSVAISGSNAVVGAFYEDEDAADANTLTEAGSAYFFKRTTSLPIELLSFTGENTEGGNLLKWKTTSETNNKGFDVERSHQPPKGNIPTWEKLGWQAGQGTTKTATNYTFTDQTPPLGAGGLNYYRLKQVDFDGKQTYSKVIVLNNDSKMALSVYPNPTDDMLYVLTNINRDVPFIMTNMLGQVVKTGIINTQTTLDISGLLSGTYYIKCHEMYVKFIKN